MIIFCLPCDIVFTFITILYADPDLFRFSWPFPNQFLTPYVANALEKGLENGL